MRSFSAASTSLVVVALGWTFPFLQPYQRFPMPSFYAEWSAFGLGLLAATLLLRKKSWREPVVPVVALAPIGLILLLALQIGFGRVIYTEQALTAALYAAWAVLMMMLGVMLRRELGMAAIATVLSWALLAGGLLNAFAGLVQHYQVSTPLNFLIKAKMTTVVFGNVGQSNHFANYVTLGIASIAYLHVRGSLHGAVAGTLTVVFLFLLALSGSRSPWFYLGALAALALLLHWRAGSAESRRLCVFTLSLLPGFVLAHWIATLPFMEPALGPPITSADRLFDLASGVWPRLHIAIEAWQMFLSAPLLGIGWGQFAWHHFLIQTSGSAPVVAGVFNHAHNIVMQLLAETGFAGALLVVGAVLLWLADLRKVRLDLEWRWLMALLAVIGIHSMLEYPLWYSNFLGVAALLAGAGACSFLNLRAVPVARGAVAAALVLGWLNLVMVLPAYRDFERLLDDLRKQAIVAEDDGAFRKKILQAHRDPVLQPYVELALSFSIAVSDEEQLRERLELHTRVTRYAPYFLVVYRQAMLLALAGERDAALTQLKRSIQVYPTELPRMLPVLEQLAQHHPDRFKPLLELAVARSAELGVRGQAR